MKKLNNLVEDTKYNMNQENLKKSFNQAMTDEIFSRLVSKLNVDNKKLYSYTSRIEDCALEFRNCTKCKNLLACKNKITGYVNIPENIEGNIEFNYVGCKYLRKFKKENDYLNNNTLYGVPTALREARIENIFLDDKNRVKAIKKMHEFITKYRSNKPVKGIYIHGNFGSGKSYLLAALLNELARDNVKSATVFYPELLRDLKASFGSNFNEKFDRIKKVPILLLDDIGAEAVTQWGRDEVLGPILQYRMTENLPTLFTSNLTIDELENHLATTTSNVDVIKARRIIERIKHLSNPVEMISKNLR